MYYNFICQLYLSKAEKIMLHLYNAIPLHLEEYLKS